MIAHHPVRLARRADAVRIAEMSRNYVEVGLGWRWTPDRVLRAICDSETNVVLVRAAGRLRGFAIMSYGAQEAHLLLLAVATADRRQGIGSALLAWLEVTVRTAGIRRICLEARRDNRAARAFYGRLGYRERQIMPGYYSGQEDAIRLIKDFGDRGPAKGRDG